MDQMTVTQLMFPLPAGWLLPSHQPIWMIWLSRSQTYTNKALGKSPKTCALALRKRQSKDLGWWQST